MTTSDSVHARVRTEVLEDIDHLAASMGRSRNWVFNEALKQYLELQKWQIDLIKERLANAEQGDAKFISNDKVIAKHKKRLQKKLGL